MKKTTQSAKTTSVFREKVFAAVSEIPVGFVTTYGSLAAMIACGSAQAIGQALRNNPFAPRVPCHRVVRANGSIGGYFGEDSPAANQRKRALLESEGVAFDCRGSVAEKFILRTSRANRVPE